MKTNHIISSLAALAIIAGIAVPALGEEKDETIAFDKVPAKVKATLAKYAAEADVKKVEKGDEDGTKVYEFDIEQGAHKFEVTISKKGKYLGQEEDVDLSAVPDAAQKGLTTAAAGGKLSGFEKATDAEGKVTYEADLDKDGKKSEIAVDADGKVVRTESGDKEDKD